MSDDDALRDQLSAGLGTSPSRTGPRGCRGQPSLAARRAAPTSIESALSRVAASADAIRAYLDRLRQLEQWLNDRVLAIHACLGRVQRVERAVAGTEAAGGGGPALPGDCPAHLLLVACYADLARQAVHGGEDGPGCGDKRDGGDVRRELTADCLFEAVQDAAVSAALAVLAATDQRRTTTDTTAAITTDDTQVTLPEYVTSATSDPTTDLTLSFLEIKLYFNNIKFYYANQCVPRRQKNKH